MNIDERNIESFDFTDFSLHFPIAVFTIPVDYKMFTNCTITTMAYTWVLNNRTIATMHEELIHEFNFDMSKDHDCRLHDNACKIATYLYEVLNLHLANELEFLREYTMTKIIAINRCHGGVLLSFTIDW